ncbi:ABC transporter substrate-binding protein [uncultured Erythrobacter sp.]|uniref:ABC transporter substrate-binding protein n=1 Tax=uncultured Erythrobacter sp. TaxID=263913 RepID=UPI00262FDAB3|nr:ABC transporter substrate-binding protein [uncultured Erythrobacter sp.]
MKNRSIMLIVGIGFTAGLALLVALLSLERAATEDSRKELEIGYFSRAIGYAPYYVADELGWFDEHPALKDWEVTHRFYGDRATIADSFGNNLDVLLSAEIPAMMTRAQGADIRIIDVTGEINLFWIAQSELSPTSLQSLAGQQVAYQSGTSSHYGMLKSLEDAGLTADAFELKNMKAVEAEAAFETDQVAAWVVWSPFLEQQTVSGVGRRVPGSEYSYATTMTVTNDLLQDSPEVAEALVEILDRAQLWIMENRDEAEVIVAKATRQDVEVVEEALNNVDFSAELDSDMVLVFEEMARFLLINDAIRGEEELDVRGDLLAGPVGE